MKDFEKSIIEGYGGSLISPKMFSNKYSHAKVYLSNMEKKGLIKRVRWGWYWVPREYKDFYDFLATDRNFKVLLAQSASSFWNFDFIHRDFYLIGVKNKSFSKALEKFCNQRGWRVEAKVNPELGKKDYTEIDGIYVENKEQSIIGCIKNWAFIDAFAVLYIWKGNIDYKTLREKSLWKRVSGTNTRVWQVIKYGCGTMNELSGRNFFPFRKSALKDDFLSREIEEAVEKVLEFA